VLLDTGSWTIAQNHLLEAADPANQKSPSTDNGDSLFVLGVLDAWFGKPSTALGYFMKALEKRPEDALVLQEMGRALNDQKNWEAAEEHLARAIRAGAGDEARVLRIKALLEVGDTPEAESEMTALLAGRQPRDLPAPLRMLHARLQERQQLQTYSSVKSFVDQPLPELTRAVPELKGIEPASDQSPLADLLSHVAASVDKFFHSLPNTVSQEAIEEEILGRDGNIRDSRSEQFQYLLMFRADEVPLGLKEWRTRAEKLDVRAGALKGGFMRTAGFACVSLDFHATYQPGASFRLLGRQNIDGRPMDVVAFAQRPDKAQRIGRFDVDGRSVPVLVQGVAWIDSNTYQIIQMRTDLLKPPPHTRLRRQTTEIHFGEVRFKELSTPLWLPRQVTVTVEWKGKTFRNFHKYSDFKVFKVETEERRRAEGPREQEDSHPAKGIQTHSKT
jgi:hypothetical protein